MSTSIWVHELQALYEQRRLVPFIGAGISASVKWQDDRGDRKSGPSWRQLVDQAARMLGFENPELLRVRGTDLQILEYFERRNGGFADLTNWLYREMNPPDEALLSSEIHAALASMEKCELIYTTNYDDFLERSFRLHGRRVRRVAVEAHMGLRGHGEIEIVKFHGDWSYPEAMVISESDYEERLKLSTPMDLRLRADVLGRAPLFLGYSFSDWNVAYLFRLLVSDFRNLPGTETGRRAFIAVPDPSEFEYELFRARNFGVIPIRGQYREDDIKNLLLQIGG